MVKTSRETTLNGTNIFDNVLHALKTINDTVMLSLFNTQGFWANKKPMQNIFVMN